MQPNSKPRSDSKPRLRLFVPDDLDADALLTLDGDQSHYVVNVMRAQIGEAVALFNGRHGQWLGRIDAATKKAVQVAALSQTRAQTSDGDLWLLAAPLKKDCTDLVAEKAAELGVTEIWPVTTERTNTGRINGERLQARLKEAAEQCERLSVPLLHPLTPLTTVLSQWPQNRVLIYLDETGGTPLKQALELLPSAPAVALLVGPEGGFSPHERALLRRQSFVRAVSLGPRILRAETAAIAALAVIQAIVGDWSEEPMLHGLTV